MKKIINQIFTLTAVLMTMVIVSASSSAVTPGFSGPNNLVQSYQPTFSQLYSGDYSTYWPILNQMQSDQCYATSDFVIGIPPGGCSPAVVRSDLLEEQNVPVFCQLYAIKINPLIRVSTIKSISFKGDYPPGVSGISFHPARAAVKSYTTLLGDPTLENIGYVVIIVKQNRVEKNMDEILSGNLTATIYYDAEEAFGTGRADYYLPLISDAEWQQQYKRYSFWNGKGFLRLTSVGAGQARIDVMKSKDSIVRSYNLQSGQTGEMMYFPGYYCQAGLTVRLNGIVAPEKSALLNIDGDEFWVRQGSKILNDQCSVTQINAKDNFGDITINCPGQTIKLSTSKTTGEIKDNPSNIDQYFIDANNAINELMDKYPLEKKDGMEETWGEEALYQQIQLAASVGKLETEASLMNKFIAEYPTSSLKEKVQYDLARMKGTDFSNSYSSIVISNKFHSISVVEFQPYDEKNKKVGIEIAGQNLVLNENEDKSFASNEYITATKINPNDVQLKYYKKSNKGEVSGESYATILEGNYGAIGGKQVYIQNIDVPAIAHVSLEPVVKATKTEAGFTFNIGIEKRNIQLSTNKTQEMLKNLNESVKKWEEINTKLNNLVKAWKGACFATSGILMVKNMISGFSGESLARQKVMAQYKKICDEKESGLSRTECYNKYASQIDSDVNSMTTALNSVNSVMDASMQGKTTSGLFGEGTIKDQVAYNNDLRKQLTGWTFTIPGVEGVTLTPEDLTTTEQLKAALLEQQTRTSSPSVHDVAKAEAETALRNTALYVQSEKERNLAADSLKKSLGNGVSSSDIVMLTNKNTQTFQWSGKTADKYQNLPSGMASNTRVQLVVMNGQNYLLGLTNPDSNGKMGAATIFEKSGDTWVQSSITPDNFKNYAFSSAGSSGSCSYQWPDGKAAISYYESGNSKGLPAIVPFNLREGWYAMVPNSAGTFLEDSPQGYTASGDVSYFKICNIGLNKLMESGSGDDLCQTFDVNTVGNVGNFIPCPSLDSTKVRDLYTNAREAIRQASQQKDACSGTSKSITIINQRMSCGPPMSKVTGYECQDFMSPEDCKLMFNVCDPVICPPSRCDLGGKMPVSDVIQTGIIGSLVLCLPNIKEGIVVPICVSGVAAGIDSFVSILEAERDCLQTSLDTGEHVGICDEITSIYMCEFFWRQVSPVLDMILPRIIEGFYGGSQRARGGGEYMLVQSAWDNTQKSIDYFKNVYAPNAFKVFQLRNIQEAGSEVCKSFVGTSFPTSASAIDSLLEPESPSQFYAQFSETLFTEATVPSTSQYKVYYHIYAGNDIGTQYRVYLKSPPDYSYYSTTPIVNVKTGYIAKGDFADETVDFTAPSGYKELCVQINANEECGFKQVSSSLAVDYLSAKYVQDQAETTGIMTEKDCISGTPSALPMANLNIQQGVEQSVTPEIALNGIVRVCATGNPNAGTDLTRWKDVGYCGDQNLRCWLDVQSVKNDLQKVASIEGTSISLLEQQQGLIENEQLTQAAVKETLAKARADIKGLTPTDLKLGTAQSSTTIIGIIQKLDEIIGTGETQTGAGTNADRAEALSLKATVYRMIISQIFVKNTVAASGGVTQVPEATQTKCTIDEECPVGFCISGNCLECRNANNCGKNELCIDNKCIPKCTIDEECSAGFCVNGNCVTQCKINSDCGNGICTNKICTAKSESNCIEEKEYITKLNNGNPIYLKFSNGAWVFAVTPGYKDITLVNPLILENGAKLSSFAKPQTLEGGCNLLQI